MALVIKVNGNSSKVEIQRNEPLVQLSEIVGGYVQWVECPRTIDKVKYEGFVCNEEGKLLKLERNKKATNIFKNPYDYLVGNVVWLKKGELQ